MRVAPITDNDVVLWIGSKTLIFMPKLKQVVTQYKMWNEVKLTQMMCYNPGGGRVLPEKMSGGVRPDFQNPYPIYDQNLRFFPTL